MKKLTINFKNCYGISKLQYNFDYSSKNVYSIYAPNGTMKTSFAKTMMDYSKNNDTSDLIYPHRSNKREIYCSDKEELEPEKIFVVETLNESYTSENISTLMVNEELKKEYEEIHKKIDEKKSTLFKKLQQLAGLKRTANVEDILCSLFNSNDIYDFMNVYKSIIEKAETSPYAHISYDVLFNDKSYAFLKKGDVVKQIESYIKKYDELIEQSQYLQKGFNHFHAKSIHKSLKDNGFFDAKHSVNLFNGKGLETVKTEEDLNNIIDQEIEKVLNSKELKKQFNSIDKLLSNAQLRELREYLEDHQEILTELNDLDSLQKNIWLSYLIDQKSLFLEFYNEYLIGKDRINEIIDQAKKEETTWKAVVDIFNQRFSLPFVLDVENQSDVILRSSAPSIRFIYFDREESQVVEKNNLLKILSMGEKRALYLLNIIFEIEVRKDLQPETLFVFDDIADSFDYKNKYAIIEYLYDISKNDDFCLIILTHNFDFHRTVCSRLDMCRANKLCVQKEDNEIKLIEEHYQNNPFIVWKNNFGTNKKMFIALIPFIRNIAEYTGNQPIIDKLTSLLHIKSNTYTINHNDIIDIYNDMLNTNENADQDNENSIVDEILAEADNISSPSDQPIDLEDKIVMSIAIRLIAEQFMIDKIDDNDFIEEIKDKKHQTNKLYTKFKEIFPDELEIIKILQKVNLMTPENIHLNSFMYEPILDMDIHHLVELYEEIVELSP